MTQILRRNASTNDHTNSINTMSVRSVDWDKGRQRAVAWKIDRYGNCTKMYMFHQESCGIRVKEMKNARLTSVYMEYNNKVSCRSRMWTPQQRHRNDCWANLQISSDNRAWLRVCVRRRPHIRRKLHYCHHFWRPTAIGSPGRYFFAFLLFFFTFLFNSVCYRRQARTSTYEYVYALIIHTLTTCASILWGYCGTRNALIKWNRNVWEWKPEPHFPPCHCCFPLF